MKQYGLLGYPLSHSFSSGYFSEKFKREGIEAVYHNFALPSIEELPALIVEHPFLVGLNVTIPYKQAVIRYLDDLDPEAERIGAVNTVCILRETNKPRLVGYNSDLIGFRESIRPFIDRLRANGQQEPKALILGTGGASKAIEYGLEQLGIQCTFVSRTSRQGVLCYDELDARCYERCSIIINTTPLGMYPNVQSCPPIRYDLLGPGHVLYDAVYNPEKTLFLQKGEAQGATIKNGLEMLHLQAEASWKIWNAVF